MGISPGFDGRTRRILPILFFLSGFASLILELTWARRLSQMTGSGVRASGAVAALLVGGLFLGALATSLCCALGTTERSSASSPTPRSTIVNVRTPADAASWSPTTRASAASGRGR